MEAAGTTAADSVAGKEKEMAFLREFIASSKWNICLMYGAPGRGKTFILKVLSDELEAKG